ncbi:MAG: hypothetical protein ACYCSQ_00825 [bacterium]
MLKKLNLFNDFLFRLLAVKFPAAFTRFLSFFVKLSILAIGILTVINGVKMFLITLALVPGKFLSSGSLHFFQNIIWHDKLFAFFMTLGVLSHSSKAIAVQIAQLNLFAVIANEIALLSVLAGLFAFKKGIDYIFLSKANTAKDTVSEDITVHNVSWSGTPPADHTVCFGTTRNGMTMPEELKN